MTSMTNSGTNRPELIFALVGPAGTRLEDISKKLKEELERFGYNTVDIRLSELLPNFCGWTATVTPGEPSRTQHLQTMGDAFRGELKNGAALALAGIAEIRKKRMEISGSPDKPASNHAYILRQLKHPDEVNLFRRVYGSSFYLIAGHAPKQERMKYLGERWAREESQSNRRGYFEGKALGVITVDENHGDDFGQNTRDTYPLADFFANLGLPGGEHSVQRFVDLIFGHPFHTPQPDEYAMYQASAVALRSSDDNRQVGAVIVNLARGQDQRIKNADVIAVGMNEVPRGGGGFYWDLDSPDHRDQRLVESGNDRAKEIKVSALAELIERMVQRGWLEKEFASIRSSDLARQLLPNLRRTQFMDIGEFSRPVHAEMATLIDAARRGVAVAGHSMYVTTFPCHNCAKHIIAAGIRRVVYLEPYPKSRALDLHGEEITAESLTGNEEDNKVVFYAFTGVAPCQYRQLFSMTERGAKKGNSLTKWYQQKRSLHPQHIPQDASILYVAAERRELANLSTEIFSWDKQKICELVTVVNPTDAPGVP
jgi:deoxycytidylate deaminase